MAGIQWRVFVVFVAFGLLGAGCALGDGGLLAEESDSGEAGLSGIDAGASDSENSAEADQEINSDGDATVTTTDEKSDEKSDDKSEDIDSPSAEAGDEPAALEGPLNLLSSWEAPDAPHPVSNIVTCDNTVLYESLPGDQLEMVALDATDGSIQHRHEVNRGYILRGQHGSPAVNCDADLFYTLNNEDKIEARTVTLGELVWTSYASANTFEPCGPKLCVSLFGGGDIKVLNGTTGEQEASFRVTDTRVLAQDDTGFRLRPNADSIERGVTELIATRYDEELWRMGAKTVRDVTGHRFTPSTGWFTIETGDANTQTQYLGPVIDEAASADDRVQNGGVVFSYNTQTGDLLWALGDMVGCFYPEDIFCHFAGYEGGFYEIDHIVRIDPATGATLWQYDVPDWPIMTRHGDYVSIDFPKNSSETRRWIDVRTGEGLAEAPELPFMNCQTYGDLPEGIDWLETYSESTDALIQWAPTEFTYPCGTDDGPIVSGELIASAPELLDHDSAQANNGWFIMFDGEQVRGYQLG